MAVFDGKSSVRSDPTLERDDPRNPRVALAAIVLRTFTRSRPAAHGEGASRTLVTLLASEVILAFVWVPCACVDHVLGDVRLLLGVSSRRPARVATSGNRRKSNLGG